MEAFSGQEALISWMKNNALGDIQACLKSGGSWQELHQTLAAFGLAIKPRGAGLVIVTTDGKIAVRASRFFRALSIGALTKRWGTYQPATGPMPSAKMRYERAPKRKYVANTRLWAMYREQRRLAQQGRAAALAEFREQNAGWSLAIKKWWSDTEFRIRHAYHRTAEGRRPMWDEAHHSLNRKVREIHAWREKRFQDIARTFPLPTWFGFLQREAARGDSEALAILRLKEEQQREVAVAFTAIAEEKEARDIVFSRLRPHVRKNGHIVYNLRDGGRIIDTGNGITLETETPQAMFLTLCINEERWPGRPVPLAGRDEFKQQMVEIAARTKLDMRFADPALEQLRCRLRGLPEPPLPLQPSPQPHAAQTRGTLFARLGQAIMGNSGKGRG